MGADEEIFWKKRNEMRDEFERAVLKGVEDILKSDESRNYEVMITSELAVSIIGWLQVSKAHMIGFARDDRPNEESIVWSLIRRLKDAIPSDSMYKVVPVNVGLNWRDVDYIGRIMLRGKNTPAYFRELNAAFVEAGGRDNVELRTFYERSLGNSS